MTVLHLDLQVSGGADGWQVKLVRDNADVAAHVMAKAPGTSAQPAVAAGLAPAEVDAVLQRIRARTCQTADPVQLGTQLYAALLAPVWSNIDAALVAGIDRLELALDLHGARELAYLPWELMRGPQGYLARGVDRPDRVIEVAITRRNPRAGRVACAAAPAALPVRDRHRAQRLGARRRRVPGAAPPDRRSHPAAHHPAPIARRARHGGRELQAARHPPDQPR